MPQHRSCAKRMKTAEKSRQRNRAVRSKVRGAVKAFDAAPEGDAGVEALRLACSELDRAVKKGVIPQRRADRKKSRLAKRAQRATQAAS